jgi:hypothetical protein
LSNYLALLSTAKRLIFNISAQSAYFAEALTNRGFQADFAQCQGS